MTETNTGEVPTASLVGALAVFPLNDVLGLLSETGQRGELQVVGPGVDGHLWVDGKDFVGATLDGAKTLTQAVFEMLLLDQGWFYFTSDQAPPAGQAQRQSVNSVITEVVPQVQEWRDLLTRVPLNAAVRMARTTPGPEVQIRADQWRVLTAVGTTGRTVGSIVDELEDDSVVTVRLLRELVESGLVVVNKVGEPVPAAAPGLETQEALHDLNGDVPPPPPGFISSPPAPVLGISSDYGSGLDELPSVPPSVMADPWAPPGSGGTSGNPGGRF
jgi:hypothetical protein